MELGKVLTLKSRFLHVAPSRQEASENRCNGTGQDAYPRPRPFSILCPASKRQNKCQGTGQESSSPHYAW
jgi:hypothetical protein